MKISKKQFIHIMKDIETQLKIDNKNHEAFSIILSNDFVSNSENILYNTIIKFLMELTNDMQTKWIEYFLYELDFGKENKRLKVYDKNENEIPLSTIEDLWNILNNNSG